MRTKCFQVVGCLGIYGCVVFQEYLGIYSSFSDSQQVLHNYVLLKVPQGAVLLP